MSPEEYLEESFRLFRLIGNVNQIKEQKEFLEKCQEEGAPLNVKEIAIYDYRLENQQQYDLAISLILKDDVSGCEHYSGWRKEIPGGSLQTIPRHAVIEVKAART